MNLEAQVISLELAKRLKEMGVKQKSLFYWADQSLVISYDYEPLLNNGKVRTLSCVNNAWPDQDVINLYSAFTVAELGQLLPDFISTKDNEIGYIKTQKKDEEWKIYIDMITRIIIYFYKNEANARAKMLIHLLENGLIEND